jgi:hypothetical protein
MDRGMSSRRSWRRVAAAAVAVAAACAAPDARAQGLDRSCELSLTRLEATTANVLLVDTSATYWIVSYAALPGTRLRIEGEFPHARYMGWNLYDAAARPIESLPDAEIAPDPGSANPFLPGADRAAPARSYKAFVEVGPRPATPAPNTLYTGESRTGTLWYRIYISDEGRGLRGGVPLPRVTLERAGGSGGDGPFEPCRTADLPTAEPLHEAVADVPDPLPAISSYPGRNPPRWTLFTNLFEGAKTIVLDNERGGSFYESAPTSEGAGFFSNRDISYVFAPASRGFGRLLVIRGRAPTFPDTRAGAPTMPGGTQLRYFSFCQYDPLTQRVVDCRPDDTVAVDSEGRYTIVVANAGDRPANARPECGVTFLRWGQQKQGLLLYRHLLADPSFAQSIAAVGEPGREREVMGEYYPEAEYLADAAAFEARGCATGAGSAPGSGERGSDGGGGSGNGGEEGGQRRPRDEDRGRGGAAQGGSGRGGGSGGGGSGDRGAVLGAHAEASDSAGSSRGLAQTGLDARVLVAAALAALIAGALLRRATRDRV